MLENATQNTDTTHHIATGGRPCLAENDVWLCTRDHGHTGDHEARDAADGSSLATWRTTLDLLVEPISMAGEGDGLVVHRPHWMSDRDWAEIQGQMPSRFEEVVEDVTGRCTRHSWCTMDARGEGHDEFCSGDPTDVLNTHPHDEDTGTEATRHAWWCWLAQSVGDQQPSVVFEGRLNDGGRDLSFEVDRSSAVALLQMFRDMPGRAKVAALLRTTDERGRA